MLYKEFCEAVEDAERTLRLADQASEKLAIMLVGRLRKASKTWSGAEACANIKRELRKFNIQTRQWND